MLIDKYYPDAVGGKSIVKLLLLNEARANGISDVVSNMIRWSLPPNLREAGCFFDRLTGLWRYEFGTPYEINNGAQIAFGANIWIPLIYLLLAMQCAIRRLPEEKRKAYLGRLSDPVKHADVLAEMLPILGVDDSISTDFEVSERTADSKTIDWYLRPFEDRPILFDVKHRVKDLLEHLARMNAGDDGLQAPAHDHAILFRGIEEKFVITDPDLCLQGAWIISSLKQDPVGSQKAFNKLDPQKVHFAILSGWEAGAVVLTRREIDRDYLIRILAVKSDLSWNSKMLKYECSEPHRTAARVMKESNVVRNEKTKILLSSALYRKLVPETSTAN